MSVGRGLEPPPPLLPPPLEGGTGVGVNVGVGVGVLVGVGVAGIVAAMGMLLTAVSAVSSIGSTTVMDTQPGVPSSIITLYQLPPSRLMPITITTSPCSK